MTDSKVPPAPSSNLVSRLAYLGAGYGLQDGPQLAREASNEIKRLHAALNDIQEFGRKNAGCGYSCAKKAEAALSGTFAHETKTKYTAAIGDAGDDYLKSVGSSIWSLPASFRWHELWGALCRAAKSSENGTTDSGKP